MTDLHLSAMEIVTQSGNSNQTMELRQSLIQRAVSHNEEQIYVVCKPEAKIPFTRKCLCSNSQTDL